MPFSRVAMILVLLLVNTTLPAALRLSSRLTLIARIGS
jgi:hypothetical protein